MTDSSELTKGTTKMLILSVIANEALYGYQIIKAIKEKSSDTLKLGVGTIYPALHALEKNGYLVAEWIPQENVPDRKYYKLTTKGRLYLKTSLENWKAFASTINTITAEVKWSWG